MTLEQTPSIEFGEHRERNNDTKLCCKRPRNNIQCEEPPPLRRLVSHEVLCCDSDYGSVSYSCSDDNGGSMASPRRGSSNQTFSDFDANETLSISKHLESTDESDHESSATVVPHQPNPLHDSYLLAVHTKALHIESELFPLRLILSRLMNHAQHNRKGLFNTPVDPILLKLPDYTTVITNPMDLGTIKARLHAAGYSCREDVANDIRLVFQNSMKYNPPGNSVHDAAKTLLSSFEETFAALPQKGQPKTSVPGYTVLSANQIHTQSTKPLSQAIDAKLPAASLSNAPLAQSQMNQFHKTGKNLRGKVKPMHHHFCQSCMGRTCSLCQEGCIPHEASLLICTGSNCNGARIRKGAYYFIAKDGSRQFCQRCYTNLSPVLPHSGDGFVLRYKRDLLKRKNDEEVMEEWVTCSKCFRGAHKICAMHNEFVHDTKDYCCPGCMSGPKKTERQELSGDSNTDFTFLSGSDLPVKLPPIIRNLSLHEHVLRADLLKNDTISSFLERKVRERMVLDGCEEASRSVTVRMISDCRKYYKLPEVVRKHFRMGSQREEEYSAVDPPAAVKYNSKAFTLFQKIDGLDVFIFCMYVQEYDECEEEFTESKWLHQNKRVNIAYIDSVEHFRPRSCRTSVFHEMLVSYLATARARGYETAHIWACPPSRGNSFVFWNHPASQRTPTRDRLISWYHGAISRAIECGIVSDVKSLYEFAFQNERSKADKTAQRDGNGRNYGRTICPPLIEGDFWIEEAVRIHTASMARYLKSNETFKKNPGSSSANQIIDESNEPDFCPALQVASLLRKRVMSHPSSAPFRRPVNTAALKLKDYHIKISRPMDLGTVYSRCVLGEFETLRDLVSDVVLVFSNAMLYNPKGHYVHNMAIEIQRLFFVELDSLAKDWHQAGIAKERAAAAGGLSWIIVAELSMSLDLKFKKPSSSATKVEEDATSLQQSKGTGASVSDTSCDGSSCCSLPCTGIQRGQTADDSQAPSLLVSPTQSQCSKDMSFDQKVEEKQCNPQEGLDLLTGGSDAVLKSMVGSDVWLMDKKSSLSPKGRAKKKKKKDSSGDPSNENSSSGQRRQTWLGDEVAESIRSLRTSFFVCSLSPKEGMTDEEKDKVTEYQAYAASFLEETQLPDQDSSQTRTPGIADARHALLEFSQYRKFEFDTLRRAKYSTAMLLYYIQNADAPGLVPRCSSCTHKIRDVRWHKITKADERSRGARASVGPDLRQSVGSSDNAPEDLCPECYSKAPNGDDFVPLMVSVHG